MLCCPPLHGLHARLSSRQYLRLPLLHCPSRRNLLHRPPCSVPCTALCLCLAHSRPRVALKSWRDLQCPPCSLCLTPHTLHSSASLPLHARTPTACTARRSWSWPSLVQRPRVVGTGGGGGGVLHNPRLRAPDGPVAPQSRGPSPQASSPQLLGSEPCSVFAHPRFSLPFVLVLLSLSPHNSCTATRLKVGATADINCPSASGDLIPLSLKTTSNLPSRLFHLLVALPLPC